MDILAGARRFPAVAALFLFLIGCAEQPKQTATPARAGGPDTSKMVYVPAGKFIMGNYRGDAGEQPQRTVYLSAYYIDKDEVTNAEYEAFVKATKHPEPMGIGNIDGKFVADFRPWRDSRFNKPNQPVVCVGWDDAAAYAKWAGKRLPTEAEWEKAARGVDGRLYPWGDFWEPEYCNSMAINSKTKTTNFLEFYNKIFIGDPLPSMTGRQTPLPVGSFPSGRSPYGCYDMAGNVAEWVADYFDAKYYLSAPDRNPLGPSQGTQRVIRGGGFNNPEHVLRCSARLREDVRYWSINVGFRCALTAPEAPEPKPAPPKPEKAPKAPDKKTTAPTPPAKPAPVEKKAVTPAPPPAPAKPTPPATTPAPPAAPKPAAPKPEPPAPPTPAPAPKPASEAPAPPTAPKPAPSPATSPS